MGIFKPCFTLASPPPSIVVHRRPPSSTFVRRRLSPSAVVRLCPSTTATAIGHRRPLYPILKLHCEEIAFSGSLMTDDDWVAGALRIKHTMIGKVHHHYYEEDTKDVDRSAATARDEA